MGSARSLHGRRHNDPAPRHVSEQLSITTLPEPSGDIVSSTKHSNSYHEFLYQQRLARRNETSVSQEGDLSSAMGPHEEPIELNERGYEGFENAWIMKIMAAGLLLGAAL